MVPQRSSPHAWGLCGGEQRPEAAACQSVLRLQCSLSVQAMLWGERAACTCVRSTGKARQMDHSNKPPGAQPPNNGRCPGPWHHYLQSPRDGSFQVPEQRVCHQLQATTKPSKGLSSHLA